MHRTMAVVLFGLSLLMQSPVVSADATPYPARILSWCLSSNHVYHVVCGFTSATEACASVSNAAYVFDNFTMEHGYSGGSCWYRIPHYPPGSPLQNDFHWFRDTYCYKGGLQDDVSVAAPICSCRFFPPGYVYPPVFPNADLSLCVPNLCPVDDIPPFGPPDPPALDMTNISPLARRAADCLLSALGIVNLGGAGDAAVFESGYRTLEYQQHFVDLWAKKEELKDNANPHCAELKAKINDHFNRHGLGKSKVRPAVGASCHSSGTCFDVKSAHIPGVDQNAFACKIRRPLAKADPIHVVPY